MLIPVIEPLIDAVEEISPVVSSVIEPIIEPNLTEIEDILVEPVIDPLIIPEIVLPQPPSNTTGQQECVFLNLVPADIWVNFPPATFAYHDWRIYLNNVDISDSLLFQDHNGTMQIKSSIELANLKFVYS